MNEETEKKAVDKEGDAVMVVWKVRHSHLNNDRGDLDGRGQGFTIQGDKGARISKQKC